MEPGQRHQRLHRGQETGLTGNAEPVLVVTPDHTRQAMTNRTDATLLKRRTLAGLWLHLLWRTHMVSPEEAEHLFRLANLQEVRCLMPERTSHFRKLSVACCGIKQGLGRP